MIAIIVHILLLICVCGLILCLGAYNDSSVWGEDDYPMRKPARVADEAQIAASHERYANEAVLRTAVRAER